MTRQIKRWAATAALVLLALGMASAVSAQDRYYRVLNVFEATDQGRVMQNRALTGWLILRRDGAYLLQLSSQDQGTYRHVPAAQNQGREMVYFQSATGRKFFAYPYQNGMMVWLQKSASGGNLYLNAVASPPPGALPGTATRSLPAIKGGRFSATVMFGDTSAPNLLLYDRNTGEISANEKGIVFRPNGTFALRAEFGNTVTTGHGQYQIQGNRVLLRFSDGSGMTLVLEKGGRNLNWYGTGGMLISEFFFLGVAK